MLTCQVQLLGLDSSADSLLVGGNALAQIPVGRLDVRVLEVFALACGTTNMIKYSLWPFFKG